MDHLHTCAPLFPLLFRKLVLRELLHPRTWKPSEDRSFILNAEQINELCDEAERIFRDEATVLQLQGAEKRGAQAR
jgi:protein phosphatase